MGYLKTVKAAVGLVVFGSVNKAAEAATGCFNPSLSNPDLQKYAKDGICSESGQFTITGDCTGSPIGKWTYGGSSPDRCSLYSTPASPPAIVASYIASTPSSVFHAVTSTASAVASSVSSAASSVASTVAHGATSIASSIVPTASSSVASSAATSAAKATSSAVAHAISSMTPTPLVTPAATAVSSSGVLSTAGSIASSVAGTASSVASSVVSTAAAATQAATAYVVSSAYTMATAGSESAGATPTNVPTTNGTAAATKPTEEFSAGAWLIPVIVTAGLVAAAGATLTVCVVRAVKRHTTRVVPINDPANLERGTFGGFDDRPLDVELLAPESTDNNQAGQTVNAQIARMIQQPAAQQVTIAQLASRSPGETTHTLIGAVPELDFTQFANQTAINMMEADEASTIVGSEISSIGNKQTRSELYGSNPRPVTQVRVYAASAVGNSAYHAIPADFELVSMQNQTIVGASQDTLSIVSSAVNRRSQSEVQATNARPVVQLPATSASAVGAPHDEPVVDGDDVYSTAPESVAELNPEDSHSQVGSEAPSSTHSAWTALETPKRPLIQTRKYPASEVAAARLSTIDEAWV